MDEGKRNAPIWLKLIVGFHVLATLSWSIPKAAPAVSSRQIEPRGVEWVLFLNDRWVRVSPIQQYILSMGLWQSWDMFAPNPASNDIWCDAIVEYKNGRVGTYQYPRVYEQSYFWKYVKERYRKYYERVNLEKFSFLWEPFAKRIALLADDEPGNPPVRVILRRHYRLLPHTTTFATYLSDLGSAIRAGRANTDVFFPPSPPTGEFSTSAFYTWEPTP